jgi:hypothetical protein
MLQQPSPCPYPQLNESSPQTPNLNISKLHHNIILSPMPRSSKSLYPFGFKCPGHLAPLDLNIIMSGGICICGLLRDTVSSSDYTVSIFGEENKLGPHIQFTPASCYFFPLRSTYSAQLPVLNHPQSKDNDLLGSSAV